MTTAVSVAVPAKKKAHRSIRIGLAIRMILLVALVALAALNGAALKTRAFEGTSSHYTVVLQQDADLNASSADLANQFGFKVDQVLPSTGAVKAYTAVLTDKEASQLRSDPRVAYTELDSVKKIRHGWWDTAMITLGMHTPHMN